MNKIPNRQAICEVLMKHAETDKDIVVLCSDSRGSASLTPFANAYPEQFVEMGIAEQDLVSVSAGLAKCGKKAFAASPACIPSYHDDTRHISRLRHSGSFYEPTKSSRLYGSWSRIWLLLTLQHIYHRI